MPDQIYKLSCEDAISLCCDAIWPLGKVSPSGHFQWVNAAYCSVLNAPVDLVLGTHYRDWTDPSDIDIDDELAGKVLSGELPGYTLAKRYIQRGSTPNKPRIVWGLLSVQGEWDGTKFKGYLVQFRPYNNFAEAKKRQPIQWKAIGNWAIENWKTIMLIIAASMSLIYGGSEKLLDVLKESNEVIKQSESPSSSSQHGP